ncbi:hypothetical protein HK104_003877 [Borealophlyctis nickersoniae]|nr:hypothetical protein HK104_003877 [Borealophlyctis nickersoniae]
MTSIRILTLNFFLRPPGVSEGGTGDWKSERLRLFAQTEFQNYDIIAFQELFAFGTSRRDECITLAKEKGFLYSAACPKMPWYGLRVDAGLLILSRYPIDDVKHHTFGRGTEVGDWLAAKGVLYAKIQPTPDYTLHLFTTHLQSTDNPQALKIRNVQFHEAKEFIDETLNGNNRQPHEPVLFVGDMNVDARANGDDGVGHGWEWPIMTDIFSGKKHRLAGSETPPRYHVESVCYSVLGEHPITTSRLRVGPGFQDPDRKCIDFILNFRPADAEGAPLDTNLKKGVDWKNIRVEKDGIAKSAVIPVGNFEHVTLNNAYKPRT